jgi:hypothetical protein
MIKLLAIHPMEFDGTSYYRAHGIFPNLIKQFNHQLRIDKYQGDFGRGYNWTDLQYYDILFLQRPCLDAAKRIRLVNYCKDLGIKIWIDFDDNLFDLPNENRLQEDVTNEIRKDMVTILKLADVITVSTKALKEFFATLGLVTEVVPNALNEDITPMAEDYNTPLIGDPIKLLWRGSDTHQGDLYYSQNEIFKAIDIRQNTHWHFMGYNPWFITNGMEKGHYTYHKSEDLMIYFRNLRKVKPQLVHFPLMPNALNFGKSNIAWIESTAAGAVIIAPDWEEWRKTGVINYTSQEHYGELLTRSLDGDAELWKQSRDYIMENLTLDKVNEQRVRIIERLLGLSTVTITNTDFVNPNYKNNWEKIRNDIDAKTYEGFSNLPETMIE